MQTSQKDLHKKLLGRKGEVKAAKYLSKKGYEILEKNYKTRFGEIDIIALYKGTLVFVEVKTRQSLNYGYPAEAVGKDKQNKYRIVAGEFLQSGDFDDCECRFDVIEILNGEINHIENAFFI